MFFANACVVCDADAGPVCEACTSRLDRVDGPERRWSVPAGAHPAFEQCRAAFVLDDTSRTIVAALKYRNQHRLSAWFADQAVALVPQAADVLTWIPATPERRRVRGYDQGKELARQLSTLTGVPARPLLCRNRGDTRQTGQSRADRQRGPRLYSYRRRPAVAEFVVLVDDVITTGSSLRSAVDVLVAVGVRRVITIAMAATASPQRPTSPPSPQMGV